MAKIDFGGVEEEVVTRDEFPLDKALETLKNETIAVVGYGVQGPGQSQNLRDNGFNVIVGQRKGSPTWATGRDPAGYPASPASQRHEGGPDRSGRFRRSRFDSWEIISWQIQARGREAGRPCAGREGISPTDGLLQSAPLPGPCPGRSLRGI